MKTIASANIAVRKVCPSFLHSSLLLFVILFVCVVFFVFGKEKMKKFKIDNEISMEFTFLKFGVMFVLVFPF